MEGSRKTVPEMTGEVLRDIAVLVAVFYTLDAYLGRNPVSVVVTLFVLGGAILSLCISILLETYRKRDIIEP